ncbi:helix-turn-helix domain-containing protein [Agrobacterium sp. BT-220-3]|nr:helix-turn-helix domain-containing protein [Agrobacterium sp. BT-220-3]
MPHRYLTTVETSASRANANLELVDFYASKGIELLGEAFIGKAITRAGARWTAPNSPDASKAAKEKFHAEDSRVSFRAARALLNKGQEEIAEMAGLSRATVKSLESGKNWAESHQTLLSFYERAGVEFTGWGDPITGQYFGVGVRWKAEYPLVDEVTLQRTGL